MIARKVSFGAQSEVGAKSREILMSVLHSLRKRGEQPSNGSGNITWDSREAKLKTSSRGCL